MRLEQGPVQTISLAMSMSACVSLPIWLTKVPVRSSEIGTLSAVMMARYAQDLLAGQEFVEEQARLIARRAEGLQSQVACAHARELVGRVQDGGRDLFAVEVDLVGEYDEDFSVGAGS